jgi:selenocysteine-specific elongation factor
VLPGDRFIIRMFSPVVTIGGGIVAEINPPRRPATFATRHERLEAMRRDPVTTLIRESAHGIAVADLIARTGLRRDEILQGDRLFDREADWLMDRAWLTATQARLQSELAAFHQANPLAPGLPKEDLRARVLPQAPSHVFAFVLGKTPAITADAEVLRLASHRVVMQSDESEALAKIEGLFEKAGLAVPTVAEVLAQSGVDQKRAQTLLAALLRERKLVRVNADLVYHATAIAALKASLAPRKGQRFAVPEFKDWTGVSRKYAIPLLEFLDRERLTRREGDQRIIV